MKEESKEPRPKFKNIAEADAWLEKKYGIKSVDRTEDLKGKAIVWFPGRVYKIPDPPKD
jgi:hypothetical protein